MSTSSDRIERLPGKFKGRNAGSMFGDLLWVVAVPDNRTPDIRQQTEVILAKLDGLLAGMGSDKTHLISASIHLADLADKAVFDAIWDDWIGEEPANWPQRSCVGSALVADILVEIKLVAVRRQ